jgi:hypothetical protein
MALPAEMQRPISGGCQCFFCKTHPDLVPMWDTLAVRKEKSLPGVTEYTWTVHYPDMKRCNHENFSRSTG